MSLEAEAALYQMIKRANENFTGGRVTKQDLLSWIITQFESNYFERNIEKIQRDHFDRLTHLGNLVKRLKKAKSEGRKDIEAEESLKQLNETLPKPKLGKRKAKDQDAPA